MPPRKKTNLELETLIEKGLVLRGSDETFKYGRISFGVPDTGQYDWWWCAKETLYIVKW